MRPRAPVLVGLAVAGVAGLGAAVVVVLTSHHESD